MEMKNKNSINRTTCLVCQTAYANQAVEKENERSSSLHCVIVECFPKYNSCIQVGEVALSGWRSSN